MKSKILKTLFLFFVFGIFFISSFFYFKYNQDTSLSSPVPDPYNLENNDQVSSLDFWNPSIQKFSNLFFPVTYPSITAKSALVYDLTTGKTLYEKDSKKRVPIASLTKIMTATIALENKKTDDNYYVYPEAIVGEDSMGLTAGETLTLSDLLYGLILHSGNDSAETLAFNYLGGRANFIKAMNDKARSYGLVDTHFTNPSGLQGDGVQYSTAYDMLVITKHILSESSLFNQISATFDYNITATSTHKFYALENETNLITSYPGVKGVKTGFTPEAGLCLVTYLDYKGHKIIAVLLGSENRRQEMKDLLDYSLEIQGVTPPKHQ